MGAVAPGSEHPAEVATKQTPVAYTPPDVARLAASAVSLGHLDSRMSVCRACPRLVEWRERVADDKRAAFAGETYWGRPVPSWGPGRARIAVVGLAPAAHGGNRTGRMFTGDRSGDWLYAALHRAGLAAKPFSTHAGDGQRLIDTRLVAAVHCAPPANKPLPAERDACRPWLERDLELLAPTLRAIVVLGGFAWAATFPAAVAVGYPPPAGNPRFGHGAEVPLGHTGPVVLGCYHPSQQNAFTGRLTEPMLDAVFGRAVEIARAK
ncbi:MAG: uracil-DNA glycosylase [Frankiaceae bacterium]|jgi:uracil-DNA glycosylase family 4|nr:uracil-DNA glycosylase [Frankiaceae bacterium]